MLIIDCHVHPTPGRDYFAEGEHLMRHMRQHGIAMLLASDLGEGWLQFPDSATVKAANLRMRELAAKHAPALQYLVYLNPQQPDWREELAAHAATAVGVKLWISLKASDGSLDHAVAVLRAAAELNRTVLIHTYHRTDGNLPGEVDLDDLIGLANRVPECRIVAAHSGGNWRQAIARKERIPANVWFDVSGGYPERGMVRRLVDAFGAERILYGSDAPGRSFGSQLIKVTEAGLTAAELELVFHTNAMRLFELEAACAQLPAATAPEGCGVLPGRSLPESSEDHFCFAGQARYWDQAATAAELAAELERHRVTAAYAVGLETIFAADRLAANRDWQKAAARFPAIRPLAAVDPRDPAATRQLEALAGFAGVWVSPYLHDYDLNDPAFGWFWETCSARRIGLWINVALSDDRFRDPELVTRPVTEENLRTFMRRAPGNRYVVQGMTDLAVLTAAAPEGWRCEDSKLSDGEYVAERFFGTGHAAGLIRGSEYPFRVYHAVDDVLYGRI